MIKINVNAAGMAKKLGVTKDRIKDASPATQAIAADMSALIAQSFATRTSPDGTPWEPSKDGDHTTGAAQQSVSVVGTPTGVRVHVASEHASFLQFGTKHSAARPFLPIVLTGRRAKKMPRGLSAAFWKHSITRIKAWVLEGKR